MSSKLKNQDTKFKKNVPKQISKYHKIAEIDFTY